MAVDSLCVPLRSGQLPPDNRVPWRASAHVNDFVPGGWYDAGGALVALGPQL
jgi:hypothetical protein